MYNYGIILLVVLYFVLGMINIFVGFYVLDWFSLINIAIGFSLITLPIMFIIKGY